MNRKKIITIIGVAFFSLGIIGYGLYTEQKIEEKRIHLLDGYGDEYAQIVWDENGNQSYLCEDELYSYVDVTYKELIELICQKEEIGEEDSKGILKKKEWWIETTLNQDIQRELSKEMEENTEQFPANIGVEINDTKGKILACASKGKEENYILSKNYAGSTMKPLSVYGAAMENKVINWSSMILDAPYKKVKTTEGEYREWPQNTVDYTYKEILVADAVKKSLNTVAVRVLKENGVKNVCDFLEQKFDMNLQAEREVMQQGGEDEVLGNIALGYLRNGISIKDITGYYQVFANGGTYRSSYTIQYVKQENGLYYKNEITGKRVFSVQTSYIMNRMLKRVLEEGGTGSSANVQGYDLIGKTGTSEENKDNWFVACSPDYVCALWNDADYVEYSDEENINFKIYSDIIPKIQKKDKTFIEPEGIEKKEICELSGLEATEKCKNRMIGYYDENTVLQKCTE